MWLHGGGLRMFKQVCGLALFAVALGCASATAGLIVDERDSPLFSQDLETRGSNDKKGVRGPTGPRGEQGAQGLPGMAGIRGATGLKGASGATGAPGGVGAKGVTGATGATGAAGARGATGATGALGATGARGATGAAGATGAMGLAGAKGETGAKGATGANGVVGATGVPGAAGLKGATGDRGATGPVGATGAIGALGVTGKSGIDGKAGATGEKGRDGATGAIGLQGATGVTGPKGDSGVLAPLSSDLFVDGCTRGSQGEQDGSIGRPFKTIEQALSAAKALTTTSEDKVVTILIASGSYSGTDGTILITGNAKIALIALGPVYIGGIDPSGANSPVGIKWVPTWANSQLGRRPTLTITSLNSFADAITPHQSYSNKIRITGGIEISTANANDVSDAAELHLSAEVYGDLQVYGKVMLYVYKCRFHGMVWAEESDLVVAERTRFDQSIHIHFYGTVLQSEIMNGVEVTGCSLWDQASCSIALHGFFVTYFKGDFKGVSGDGGQHLLSLQMLLQMVFLGNTAASHPMLVWKS